MDAYYSDRFVLPLPAWHRFPMAKYERLRNRIRDKGLEAPVGPVNVIESRAADDEELLGAHDADYVDRATHGRLSADEVRALGFPWSAALIERSRRSCAGTIDAVRSAFRDGVAVNLAGGTHHAHRDRCSGYCVFNDAAVAARSAIRNGLVQKVLIFDADVHHGDGTATIFAADPQVFTCSLHNGKNFPLRKPPSDLDFALDDGTNDDTYLAVLEYALDQALARSLPDLIIYLAGADPYEGDALGRLKLTKAGLQERDRRVIHAAVRARIPVAVAMAGGYAPNVDDIVDIHWNTVITALTAVNPPPPNAEPEP